MANKLLLGMVIGVVVGAGATLVLTGNVANLGSSLGVIPPLKVEKFGAGGEMFGASSLLRITNTGTEDIKIQDLAINDRDECSNLGDVRGLRKNGRILKVGEVLTWPMTCEGSMVRVTVKTDHGNGSYSWK
jgi:hypothetical protein